VKEEIKYSLQSSQLIELPHHADECGDLTVLEGGHLVPFNISRVFTVRASKGSVRGGHAHRKCSQFMVCVIGSIKVLCDDGERKKTYILDNPSIGLNVQPGVWAEQKYLEENTTLIVLCDRPYEEEDYIRNYEDFVIFLQNKQYRE
jgi:dTDP-4-dehydrorhamnose 3,5-epimerase-like enzyme